MKLHKAAHTAHKTKISYCLDKPMLKKDFTYRGKKWFENKTSGNKKTLSRLGIYRDISKEKIILSYFLNI